MPESIYSIVACWLISALAAERIAEIITVGDIFAEWRTFLSKLANPIAKSMDFDAWVAVARIPREKRRCAIRRYNLRTFLLRKAHKLFTCGLCMSVWTSFFVSLTLPGKYCSGVSYDNIIVKWFALVFLANIVHIVFRLAQSGRVRTYDLLVKMQKDNDDDGSIG